MDQSNEFLTRRDFLRTVGTAAVGLAVGLPQLTDELSAEETLSQVVLVRHKDVVSKEGKVDGAIISDMLDQAVMKLFGGSSPAESWKLIVKPSDIVGIKSNEWNYLPTPPEIEQAIRRRVIDVGVSEKNVDIDDRGVLGNPIFKKATALINVRPLRTHAWSAVGTLIKNYIMFVPNPEAYHGNSCADLGAIWHLPPVKGKTRLNILVMLTPLFYGVGPHHFDRTYVWNYSGLLVGTDPVAVDTVGVRIFQAKRIEHFGEDRAIVQSAHHIVFADTKYHLGTSDLKKIKVHKLGWEEGVLI